jgi:hypothetical protein
MNHSKKANMTSKIIFVVWLTSVEILDLIRQIERANERLKTPPKKNWIH